MSDVTRHYMDNFIRGTDHTATLQNVSIKYTLRPLALSYTYFFFFIPTSFWVSMKYFDDIMEFLITADTSVKYVMYYNMLIYYFINIFIVEA